MRKKITPEEAMAAVFAVMMKIPDATMSQVVARTGVSHPTATKYMRMWKAKNADGVEK